MRDGYPASVASALMLVLTFPHTPPWEAEPWKTIADENSPGAARMDVPVLVVQGGGDTVVDAQVTERLVENLCGRGHGEATALSRHPPRRDLGVAAPDVAAWIAERFAGKPPTTCRD